MSEPTPAPSPIPGPVPEGLLGHFRAWFERDILPEIDALKGDVGKVRALAPELSAVANTVVALAKAADPAASPEIAALAAGAERAAGEIARVAGELAATGM